MSKRIYKYPIKMEYKQDIYLPKGAEVLSIQNQGEKACIWALCDPNEVVEKRFFRIYGTGDIVSDSKDLNYIGTCQFRDGALVLHYFELLTA